MPDCRLAARRVGVFVLWAALGSNESALAVDKDAAEKETKMAGILIEKKDDSITVKADGDDELTKYVFDKSDKKLADNFKTTFDACRVQLTYKQDGETRRLTSIKRQIIRATGTFTGEVVKVHNNFWVEVKPKTGVADAFAPGAGTWNNKEFMDKLKGLQAGDSVTITFTTDFERHRIKTMQVKKKPEGSSSASSSSKTDSPSKK